MKNIDYLKKFYFSVIKRVGNKNYEFFDFVSDFYLENPFNFDDELVDLYLFYKISMRIRMRVLRDKITNDYLKNIDDYSIEYIQSEEFLDVDDIIKEKINNYLKCDFRSFMEIIKFSFSFEKNRRKFYKFLIKLKTFLNNEKGLSKTYILFFDEMRVNYEESLGV